MPRFNISTPPQADPRSECFGGGLAQRPFSPRGGQRLHARRVGRLSRMCHRCHRCQSQTAAPATDPAAWAWESLPI